MSVIIDTVLVDVAARPSSGGAPVEPAASARERPLDIDEIRRRLERSLRLATRLAAD